MKKLPKYVFIIGVIVVTIFFIKDIIRLSKPKETAVPIYQKPNSEPIYFQDDNGDEFRIMPIADNFTYSVIIGDDTVFQSTTDTVMIIDSAGWYSLFGDYKWPRLRFITDSPLKGAIHYGTFKQDTIKIKKY